MENKKTRQCFFCKKHKNKLYYIVDKNGMWHKNIKSDLIEYLDENIEGCLERNDSICQGCWSVISSIVKLKNRLWRYISSVCNNRNVEVMPIDLEKLASIMTAISYEEDLEVQQIMEQAIVTPELITPTYSVDYDANYEEEMQRQQSERTLNGVEYLAAASGKMRPRSRCYSTDPQIGRRKKRPNSTLSARSLSRASPYIPPIKTYDLEKHYDQEPDQFFCPKKDCFYSKEPLLSLKTFTYHLTKHHDAKALFVCSDCQERFLTKRHLRFHKERNVETHMGKIICQFCDRICNNSTIYQTHVEKHYKFSIWCKTCEKSYLDKLDYFEHMKSVHKTEEIKVKWGPLEPTSSSTIQKVIYYEKYDKMDEAEEEIDGECKFIEMEQGEKISNVAQVPNSSL